MNFGMHIALITNIDYNGENIRSLGARLWYTYVYIGSIESKITGEKQVMRRRVKIPSRSAIIRPFIESMRFITANPTAPK